jgi:aminoglycoside phosphotransferase (APT) family kinase protein
VSHAEEDTAPSGALAARILAPGFLRPHLARLEAGAPFREVLEALLLEVPPATAERLGLVLREGRGAWLPLLATSGGRALLVGDALSGTAHALAALGFVPTLLDTDEERLALERFRCEALVGVRPETVRFDDGPRLPFEDASFDLVVREAGATAPPAGWRHDERELWRVCRGELVVTADNRLGYKRSLGARGRFAVTRPLELVARALRPGPGVRTLAGHRRALSLPGAGAPRALALYPSAADFTHVVALDEPAPRLHIGPKERRNRLKMVGHRLGLFPWLTPSFALVARRSGVAARPRIERVLDALAEETGEERPRLDEWIATRGNCVVALTRPARGDGEEGRWCLHVALGPHKHAQVERHDRVIRELWEAGSPVPVPEPIWSGELEGLRLTCERRLRGLTAPQRSGEAPVMRRMFEEVARHLERLVEEPPETLDEADFRRHFAWRFEVVARHCGREATRRNLERLRDETRERVLGRAMPRVLQHADLRSKHVQIDDTGGVLGFLDWGSSRSLDVPYFDLLQLLVHEEKQARGGRVGDAWRRLLLEERLPGWARETLDGHAAAIGLDPEVARAVERAFPVFVAAMAESNWDYSRPRWVHRSFDL